MTKLIVLLAAFALPARLEAQTVVQRVAAAGDGTVRLNFAARRGVCGNGGNNITIVNEDEHGEWESDCAPGPVRMSLRMSGGRVTEAHTYVGGPGSDHRPGHRPGGTGRRRPAQAGRAGR
jgi:hypothetical protein